MTIYYRLTENWEGLAEGSIITEDRYKGMYYLHRPLFEVVTEEDLKELIRYENESYCRKNGIEFLLFYKQSELDKFLNEKFDAAIVE